MKDVIKANPMQAQNTLGALYTEIVNAKADAWNKRTVNDVESASLSSLLTTKDAKAAQDTLAVADITSYINKGMSYGLKDTGALIYFADGVNQYGTNATLWKQIAEEALKSTGDVTAMFNATKALTQNYLARREKVHRAICVLNLKGTTTPANPNPLSSAGSTFAVNDIVRILPSATTYAGVTTLIPDRYKGMNLTIQQIKPGRVLIQELFSWVFIDDIQKI
jgi:hypothetical protein